MSTVNSELMISLESHLLHEISPILFILPADLRSRLSSELAGPEIHYSLLADISKWSRTDAGKAALATQGLNETSYSMVSLLAGAVTAPSSKPPPYIRPESGEDEAARRVNDRKAITAIVNALLSIGGSGVATWWAADKLRWRDEWKALLAVGAAAVVAVSEIVLYIIWQSRKAEKLPRHERGAAAKQKKRDREADVAVDTPEGTPESAALRRRVPATNTEEAQ